jgi:hypothetical protein
VSAITVITTPTLGLSTAASATASKSGGNDMSTSTLRMMIWPTRPCM